MDRFLGKWLQIVILITISSILFIVQPQSSYACSCAQISSVEDALHMKTAVFSGKVVKVNENEKGKKVISSADPVEITLEVDRVWKGEVGRSQIVYTAIGEESCGFTFQMGNEYVVYAHSKTSNGNEQLETHLCDRTGLLAAASDDLEILGEGMLPSNTNHTQNSEIEHSPWIWFSLVAFGVLTIYSFYTFSRLKRRK